MGIARLGQATWAPVAVAAEAHAAFAARAHAAFAAIAPAAVVIWVLVVSAAVTPIQAQPVEDGYDLWLRYRPLEDASLRATYRETLSSIVIRGESPSMAVAAEELRRGLSGLLDVDIPLADSITPGAIVLETTGSVTLGSAEGPTHAQLTPGAFAISSAVREGSPVTVIAAHPDAGILYGAFALLRRIQTLQPVAGIDIIESPRIDYRLLNHWDNLDRTVERGYAGFSLWDWHKLPDYLDPRYTDYARTNASIGINGAVLTNVNANALILTEPYLEKAAALADVFRPYGIRVYLTARFTAPIEIGGMETADPLDPQVRRWWREKADEIYEHIPDFGGFLVKANSEGQPGPQDYGRTHADGANMLAEAVAPHGGIVMWRAFVYSPVEGEDRANQAYDEFVPLDGSFRDNVFVQPKNGPIDFQPREPFHPLFGAMPQTPLMMELQITKEYLGQATHLTYLGPMWEEIFQTDTFAAGEGSTVARVIDGSVHDYAMSGIAGVANTGTDRNWSGSHFNQADWYAFGRLAWNPDLSAADIAEEWVRMTFSNDDEVVATIVEMMMASHEAAVNYMTPLGLHHVMATGHHYGPGPWVSDLGRADWNPTYYHQADADGIGFDRTSSGSNNVARYHPPLDDIYGDPVRVPEKYLLWFHHVSWDREMPSGRTLWEELVHRYNEGVETVGWMQEQWASLEGRIDPRRHADVAAFLAIQMKEARWWRDASLAYFQEVSGRKIPSGYPEPEHTLEYYMGIEFHHMPGNP